MTGGWLAGALALHLIYGVLFLAKCIRAGRKRPSVFMCAVVICVWPLLVNRIMFMAFDDEGDHYEGENRADDHLGGDSRTVVVAGDEVVDSLRDR